MFPIANVKRIKCVIFAAPTFFIQTKDVSANETILERNN
jgi:hypothetical protein